MKFREGDYVRIIERETTSADTKSGMFYPHFCGLAGTVDKIYDKEVCIRVDVDALPEGILKRHQQIQESIRRKWLDGLSGEARNRLTPEEKRFELAYTVLVQADDLEKTKPAQNPEPAAIKSTRPLNPPQSSSGAGVVREKKSGPVSAKKAAAKAPVQTLKAEAGKPAKAAAKVEVKPPKPAAPKSLRTSAPKKGSGKGASAHPVTSADLEAAELAFLKEREKALKEKKHNS